MAKLSWKCSLPVLNVFQEEQVRQLLFPTNLSKGGWADQVLYENLAKKQRNWIERNLSQLGVDLIQIKSIYATVLIDKCPWKYHGNETVTKSLATEFENLVGRHLTSNGVKFRSEAQQKCGVSGRPFATPDFLLEEPITLNGHEIFWIEVKRFYGCGLAGLKDWCSSKKCVRQIDRYFSSFGKGAIVMAKGYSEGFKAQFGSQVVILDAAPLGMYPEYQTAVTGSTGMTLNACPRGQKRKAAKNSNLLVATADVGITSPTFLPLISRGKTRGSVADGAD
eukprot:CAMPEP_0171700628 /NCGR_PEP_ID=MMETSP0991-20121206/10624_1 /TAXON_ID=483369 /ORGANISM="non described non described, Strain CCMP2098" /LENGTH=278 /DNA_ID=CAMNT_0012289837 /DNA_START=33 /DNA_END=870 /DNA_ORIENTATION=+